MMEMLIDLVESVEEKANNRIEELKELEEKAHKLGDWAFADREQAKAEGIKEALKILNEEFKKFH